MSRLIYLASASPRRRQLLRQIGVSYRLLRVEVDETPWPDEAPHDYVARLALAKARIGCESLGRRPPHPVLGADTAVVVDGMILGKPRDRWEGLAMLVALSGREHRVLSAVWSRRNAPPTGIAASRWTRPAAMGFRAGRRLLSPNCAAATPA